jgi:DNA-binding FadR family transcriptional regulator
LRSIDPEAQRRATPRYPYEVVAAELARQIEEGALGPDDDVPTATGLAAEHDVSLSTAKRALVLAQEWGLLERLDRNTLRVVRPKPAEELPVAHLPPATHGRPSGDRTMLTFVLRRCGTRVARFSAVADLADGEGLEQLLVDAVSRSGGSADQIAEYEMDVKRPGMPDPLITLVASRRPDSPG